MPHTSFWLENCCTKGSRPWLVQTVRQHTRGAVSDSLLLRMGRWLMHHHQERIAPPIGLEAANNGQSYPAKRYHPADLAMVCAHYQLPF